MHDSEMNIVVNWLVVVRVTWATIMREYGGRWDENTGKHGVIGVADTI
jgi:hypothetical protein